MLSIEELERRWLIYKIKSYIPYAVIAISFIIISVLVFIILNPKEDKVSSNNKQTKNVEKVKEEPTKIITEDKTVEPEKVVLSPSLNFIKEIKKETENRVIKQPVKRSIPIKKNSSIKDKERKNTETVQEEKKQNVVINIGNEDTQKEIDDVIKRFKKTNSPVLSLFVAKKYYEAGNYTMAYNYALITNGIDSEIETSWLIFAKSLVKLNKKDKAIKTLKEYIQHSNSNRARTLLDEITSGKMK
jgi:hypothetical protein